MNSFLNRMLGVVAVAAFAAPGLALADAVVTDPTGTVTLTVPDGVTVEPGSDLPPSVTGEASATTTSTGTITVTYADGALSRLDRDLVALFRLDDGSAALGQAGGVLAEPGTNGVANGTAHGGVESVFGMAGLGCHFNGTSGYIALGNPAALNFTGAFSIAAWVKPEATDGIREIVAHGYATSPNGEVGLRINGGQYQIYSWNGSDHKAVLTVPAGDVGNWVHLVGTYDGTTWRLYRNGVLAASTVDATGSVTVNGDWAIGARGTGTERFFKGTIDDVGIWKRALSADEVAKVTAFGASGTGIAGFAGTITRTWTATDGTASVSANQVLTECHEAPVLTVPADAVVEENTNMTPAVTGQATVDPAGATITYSDSNVVRTDSGLKALYRLDEAYGAFRATDSSGNKNDGGIRGAVPGMAGKIDGAYQFGGSQYVDLGNGPSIGGAGSFTVSAWIKTTATGGFVLSQRDGASDGYSGGYYLGVYNGKALFQIYSWYYADNRVTLSTASVNDGQWHHILGVRDSAAGTIRLYVDGVQAASTAAFGYSLNGNTRTYMGGNLRDGNNYYSGLADDVAVWNRLLSDAEIQGIASLGNRTGATGVGAMGRIGTITRTWTAVDSANAMAVENQLLTVIHTYGPTLTLPADATVNANASFTPAQTGQATASDLVDGALPVTYADSGAPLLRGLAGLWRLDEAAGTGTTADFSGHGLMGTLYNTTAGVSGKVGTAFQFNGSSSYVSVGAPTALNNLTSTLTVAAWIKPNVVTSGLQQAIFSGGSPTGWALSLKGSGLRFTTYAIKDYDFAANIQTGVWTHVAATLDASGTVEFFVNGASVGKVAGSQGASLCTTGWYIGACKTANSAWFNGTIDEVGVWRRMLSAPEMAALYAQGAAGKACGPELAATGDTLENGLLVHYMMEEGVAGVMADASGNAQDGLPQGGVTVGITGQVGKGCAFNGTSGYVSIGKPAVLNNLTSGLTVGGWIKPNVVTSGLQQAIFTSGFTNGWALSLKGSGLRFTTYTIKDYDIAANIPVGVWTHVAATLNSSGTVEFFVNGASIGTVAGTRGSNVCTTGWYLGASKPTNNVWFNGSMDEIAVWNRVLTASEVAHLSSLGQAHATFCGNRAVVTVDRAWSATDSAGNTASGTQKITLGSLWADSDGDGLTDYVEYLAGSNPNAPDSDNDGLNDLQEVLLGTNPVKADTDGDGIADGWEVARGLNPLSASESALDPDGNGLTNLQRFQAGIVPSDFSGTATTVSTLDGSAGTPLSGTWNANGADLECDSRQGSVSYSLQVASAGLYSVAVSGRQAIGVSSATTFSLELVVDDISCGTKTLTAPYGATGTCSFICQRLSAGAHTAKIVWRNLDSCTSLSIQSVKLQIPNGPDTNTNGLPDWMDKLNAASVTVDNLPGDELETPAPTSAVSPACIEGSAFFPTMVAVHSAYIPANTLPDQLDSNGQLRNTVAREPASRWYANVPLDPSGAATSLTASAWDGGKTVTKAVTWTPTNVAGTGSVTIRIGDSLRLQPGDGITGAFKLYVDNNSSPYESTGSPVAVRFDTDGDHTVVAKHTDGSVIATLTVHVVGGGLGTDPACMIGNTRAWSCPTLPLEAVLGADQGLYLTELYNPGQTGRQFSLLTYTTDTLYILARLGDKGSVLDTAAVSGVNYSISSQETFATLEVYPDGSRLTEGRITLSSVPVDLLLIQNIIIGGVTFEDGTLTRTVTASDFDANGEYRYRFILGAGVAHSCHKNTFYQDGTVIK